MAKKSQLGEDDIPNGDGSDQLVDTYQTMAEQAETRGSLFGNHWKFYTHYLFGLVPIFKKNLSDVPPRQIVKGISRWTEISLRGLFYLRALTRTPSLLTTLVQKQAKRLLKEVSENNEPVKPQALPIWDFEKNGNADEFYEKWILNPHPVVLKGIKNKSQSWSIQGLIDRYGKTEVVFTNQEYHNYNAPLSHLLEGSDNVVHNCGSLFVEHPEMISELGLKTFEPYMRARGPVGQLFFANKKGTGTPLHCAGNFNIFFQLEGKKRWWFIDPNHMMLLYPYPSENNTYHTSLVGMPNNPENKENFPLFEYCPRYEVELEPGDVLLNPPWWYHAVENMTDRTLAVASRWFPPEMAETNRLYSVLHTEPRFIMYILRQVIAAKKRGVRANSWIIFENAAHDDAFVKAASTEGKATWGLNSSYK